MENATYDIVRLEHETEEESRREFISDVLEGLSASPKRLPSRYFYDSRGSELFQEITKLPEYYLTRAEYEILKHNGAALSSVVAESLADLENPAVNLIELGSGDGHKSFLLIDAFLKADIDFEYAPIDISEGAMETLLGSLSKKYDSVRARGLISEYFHGLNWLRESNSGRNFVLFLGSNIGNFSPDTRHGFLCRLWSALNDGDLVLIGFDLKKDVRTMIAAYNDSRNITQEFNINLLERINRELDADFETGAFEHYGPYNPDLGAMESYIISRRDQEVHIGAVNRSFTFTEAEPIHVEYSYKFSRGEIEELAENNGFEPVASYSDDSGRFLDSLWRVRK